MSRDAPVPDGADAPDAGSAPMQVSIAAHPAAMAGIRRSRALAGLVAFLAVGLLSLRAGVPAADALARGLAAGVVMQIVAWSVAVRVWRQVVLAELARAEERHRERREARTATARPRAADASAGDDAASAA